MVIVSLFRKVRAWISAFVLKHRVISCGQNVGAARIPHIGSGARVQIGSHCAFNGITITGWGG